MLKNKSQSFDHSSSRDQVLAVEASAGAGKTYALAKRYVQLIFESPLGMESNALKTILAITFTNKAAFEMKARIFEFLKKIALEKISDAELKNILDHHPEKKADACLKALRIIDGLLHGYNFFQVQTIDSFVNALLSGCSFKMGLSSNFRIVSDYYKYLELSLDRLIERSANEKNIERIFEEFLYQYLFLENRTSWFPKKDILASMGSLFSKSNIHGVGYHKDSSSVSMIIEMKKAVLAKMNFLMENLPLGTDARFEKGLSRFISVHSSSFDIDDISDYFQRVDFPIRKGFEASVQALETTWDEIRNGLRKICEMESAFVLNSYIEIFDSLQNDFRSASINEDILFLEELNSKARLLYDDLGLSVEELYYRLATKFRHFMIDEFQDTSLLQWKNLSLMIEEALSVGGTLFYVGDKKQAIYSFRGGEVKLFDALRHRFLVYGVKSEHLETNYRSRKAVVEFNNQLFCAENLSRFLIEKEEFEREQKKKNPVVLSDDERNSFLNVFQNANQKFIPNANPGYVQVDLIDAVNKESRDEQIYEKFRALIQDLRGRVSLQGIACLARDNEEVEQITNWLLSLEISVDSDRTSNIRENALIKEIVSFLSFLDSPIDNLNFSSFIMGDIFLRTTGLSQDEIHRFIFQYRNRITKQKDLYLYKEFREKYPELWTRLFEELFKNVGFYPLYELVLNFLNRFDVFAEFPQGQGFIMKFLELIKDQESENLDINSFLEYFYKANGEDFYVNVTDSNAIKVLTIHKAKGLEFSVVVIPFLEMDVQVTGGRRAEKSYVVTVNQDSLELIHLKQQSLPYSEKLYALYKEEYLKLLISELNTVYVALTRAVNEMYIFVPKKAGNSFNIARFLFPSENFSVGNKTPYIEEGKSRKNILRIPPTACCDWIEFLRDEFLDVSEVGLRESVQRGKVIHAVLSQIHHVPKGFETEALNKAIEIVSNKNGFSQPLNSIKEIILCLLNESRLKQFFDVADAEILTELEVISPSGKVCRFDRVIVRLQEVWVVDYKSQPDAGGAQAQQLTEYMGLLREIYPKKIVRGFIIYLNDLRSQEIVP